MHPTLERWSHAAFVVIGKVLVKVLPDRIPVTFVGADAVADLAQAAANQGMARALVVTDEGLVAAGIVSRVTDTLEAAGVEPVVYAEVTPDPTFAVVEGGHARFVAERCDGVVALGGGSPMDTAKMIAAMATNGGDLAKLEGKFKVRKPPAPVFAVPTTAGTGSEVTVAAVVSDTDTHAKKFFVDPKLLPDMAALDPGLMTGLPPAMTAATGMDALTHAVEAYVSKTATDQTDDYARTAVKLIFGNLRTAHATGEDLDARRSMALASYYAGLAFTRTSVGYVHAIAHNLGARYGTPHGLANALALPHVLEFSTPEAGDRLAELAGVIGLEDRTAAGFIAAVRQLAADVDVPPTLADLRREDIPALAEHARAEAYLDYPVPRWMEPADAEAVIAKLLPT